MGGELLKQFVGRWSGNCKTWLEAGQLSDESEVEGKIVPILDAIVRHEYRSKLRDQPRSGEETIAFNTADKKFQVVWYDSFHMNYAIMFSEGLACVRGFTVRGQYSVGPGQLPWGWKTSYKLEGPDQLRITAYNVAPDGEEELAVETIYRRVNE